MFRAFVGGITRSECGPTFSNLGPYLGPQPRAFWFTTLRVKGEKQIKYISRLKLNIPGWKVTKEVITKL
jgi:hypothetical protein